MWPFKKPVPQVTQPDNFFAIERLNRRITELSDTVDALTAENRIDRDMPGKIDLIQGQYRKIGRHLDHMEARVQPILDVVALLQRFIRPVKENQDDARG